MLVVKLDTKLTDGSASGTSLPEIASLPGCPEALKIRSGDGFFKELLRSHWTLEQGVAQEQVLGWGSNIVAENVTQLFNKDALATFPWFLFT